MIFFPPVQTPCWHSDKSHWAGARLWTDRQTGGCSHQQGAQPSIPSPAIPAVHRKYHLKIQLPPNMQEKVALPSVWGSFSHHSTFLRVPGRFFLDPALPSSAHIPDLQAAPSAWQRGWQGVVPGLAVQDVWEPSPGHALDCSDPPWPQQRCPASAGTTPKPSASSSLVRFPGLVVLWPWATALLPLGCWKPGPAGISLRSSQAPGVFGIFPTTRGLAGLKSQRLGGSFTPTLLLAQAPRPLQTFDLTFS